jgi:hypothetical protein
MQHNGKDDPLNPKNIRHVRGRGVPNPDVRSAMAHDAIKSSKLAHLLLKPQETVQEQAIRHLEQRTMEILPNYEAQIREALRNGFSITDEFKVQLEKKMFDDIQMAFLGEGRESLHCILSVVLLGLWWEKLMEVN